MKTTGRTVKPVALAAMLVMGALVFTNFFGLSAAGYSVLVGVVFFFVDQGRGPTENSGLEIKRTGKDLANGSVWVWIAMPAVMNLICMGLAKAVMPDFIGHVLARTGRFLTFRQWPLLAAQLIVSALGEEIAWRAFFQRQLTKAFPAPAAILATSALFALGHLSGGAVPVVAYDLIFVAANSVFYGMVFHKTNNAWVSALSHWIANGVGILFLFAFAAES